MSGNGNKSGRNRHISRRRWLKAVAGTATITGFAGCGGDGDGDTPTDEGAGPGNGTDTPTDGMEVLDVPLREEWQSVLSDTSATSPSDIVVNLWHQRSRGEGAFYSNVTGHSVTHHELLPIDLESVDATEEEMRITLKDGIKWHTDGEVVAELTAEDYALQKKFDRELAAAQGTAPEDPLIVDWHADGEKTVVFEYNPSGVNPAYVGRLSDIDMSIAMYRDGWYAEQLTSLEDASSDSERQSIAETVATEEITLADSPPLSGPYYIESFQPRRVTMKRLPEHWTSEINNWDTYEIVKLSGGELRTKQQAGLANDRIDFSHGYAPETISQLQSHLQQVDAPSNWGETIMMNYKGGIDRFMGLREGEDTAGMRQAKVRQAIVLAADGTSMVKNRHTRSWEAATLIDKGHPGRPNQVQSLLPDLYEQLPNYFAEAQPDLAEQRLEEAGLTKESGTWVKPNGEPLTIEIQSFPWVRDPLARLAQDLQDVGIEAGHVAETYTSLVNQFPEGSYSVTQSWNGVASTQPLSDNIWKMMVPPTTIDGIVNNMPEAFKVPPVGDIEGEPTETVRVDDLVGGFQSTPQEELKPRLRKLLWVHAYHLPGWHLWSLLSQVRINRTHFQWPNAPDRSSDGFSVATEEDHPVWGDFSNSDNFRYGAVEGMQAKPR